MLGFSFQVDGKIMIACELAHQVFRTQSNMIGDYCVSI